MVEYYYDRIMIDFSLELYGNGRKSSVKKENYTNQNTVCSMG